MSILTGVTTTVELLHNGVPAFIVAKTDFTDEVEIETRTRMVLGQARSKKDQIIRAYKGTMNVDIENTSVSGFQRAFYAELDAGISPDLSIIETSVHVDTGQSTTRQWMQVTLEGLSRSVSGTSSASLRLSWTAAELVIK